MSDKAKFDKELMELGVNPRPSITTQGNHSPLKQIPWLEELGAHPSPFKPIPGKRTPKPSTPWIDANDLRENHEEIREGKRYMVHQWRDTRVFLLVDPDTNEVQDMWEE